jgi:adenosylcobyric acid synthase
MVAKALMVVGTTSDSGKSTIVMALCRIFADMGYKVAPFKSQNMSLNSFVSENGEEIARSQVVQALAARVKPRAIHNPILLKPKGNMQSQIILMGKPFVDYTVDQYYRNYVPQLIQNVKDSLNQLIEENDLVIIEGAGSPAEINLYGRDIANLFVAKLINCPAILVGDIDRGGVFASIYGTIELLPPDEKELVKAFLINKFRGDPNLLTSGITQLEELTHRPCLGIVPYGQNLHLPAEDSMNLKESLQNGTIQIKIIHLPKISNFTDFEPFILESDVSITYCSNPKQLDDADLILIPGTKNTVEDLEWMIQTGFTKKILQQHAKGICIFGMCGGFQMLGKEIRDNAIESNQVSTYPGLNLLSFYTQFQKYEKITQQVTAKVVGFDELETPTVTGYEIHMGLAQPLGDIQEFLTYQDDITKKDSLLGVMNSEKTVFGTFLHGIWENDSFRQNFLKYIAICQHKQFNARNRKNYHNIVENAISQMATLVKDTINIEKLKEIIGLK